MQELIARKKVKRERCLVEVNKFIIQWSVLSNKLYELLF